MKEKVAMIICGLMLLSPLYATLSTNSLNDSYEPMPAANTTSGWVLDQTLTVSNGAWLEDIVIVSDSVFLLLSHNGNGTVGQNSWQTNQSGWRLVKMTTIGNVDAAIELGNATHGELYSQYNGLVARLSTGKTSHDFVEIDTSLSIGDRIAIEGSNSTGGSAVLTHHASSGAGNNLVAMFSCSIPASGTSSMLSQSCTDSNNNRRYITVNWDTSTNTTSILATSAWLRETASELQAYGGNSWSGVLGPSFNCTHLLNLQPNGQLDAFVSNACQVNTDSDIARSGFGSSVTYSGNMEAAAGGLATTFSSSGSESFGGWVIGGDNCPNVDEFELEVLHFGKNSAWYVDGWETGTGGDKCDYGITATTSSSFDKLFRVQGNDKTWFILGNRALSSRTFLSTNGFLSSVGVDAGTFSVLNMCVNNNLLEGSTIMSSGSNERNVIIYYNAGNIENITVNTNNAGCATDVDAFSEGFVLTQFDGLVQSVTIFGADLDGDGYGPSNDDFPNDPNQWTDSDGDGWGDRQGYSSSDRCPSTFGNATSGLQGCIDSDGDSWDDTTDKFSNDPSQWSDTDNDGYGDNATGSNPDSCTNVYGTSTRDVFGCPDSDFDGYSNDGDDFPSNPAQWVDSDGDTYGDNPSGMGGDDCPFQWGNSSLDLQGCPDTDGDGYPDLTDALPNNPTQWRDLDGDGYGDNLTGSNNDTFRFDPTQHQDSDNDGYGDNTGGTKGDACPYTPGNSTSDRYGCIDTDGDGISDLNDGFPNDANRWLDTDGDGYEDGDDKFPLDQTQWNDTDEDGYGDNRYGSNGDPFPNDPTQFRDIDNDGFGDNASGNNPDAFPADSSQWADSDNDNFGDNLGGTQGDACPIIWGNSTIDRFGCIDTDGDGVSDLNDGFPYDSTRSKDTDEDGVEDHNDVFPYDSSQHSDSDGDGYGDNRYGSNGDPFPNDHTQFRDIDSDGYGDNISGNNPDAFPADGTQWNDTDQDGYGDNEGGTKGDACPEVFGTSTVDRYGCIDDDNDGISNANDGFPNNPLRWSDSDKDGYADEDDVFPYDPTQWSDSDGDGFGDNIFGNNADRFPEESTQWYDIDGDGHGDNLFGFEPDQFPSDPTQWLDSDNDGHGDSLTGNSPDAFPFDSTQWLDADKDGLGDNPNGNNPDLFLGDRDNDGFPDTEDPLPDLATPNDRDNDGRLEYEDAFPFDDREWLDNDGDGLGDDHADSDDDNDGYVDTEEVMAGTDPLDPNSKPFDIYIPGTSIALGFWDLIGIFVGLPMMSWVLFGYATRFPRGRKYEMMLKAATTREELESIALKYEFATTIRLLGPSQALRLERVRTELDDILEQAIHSTDNNMNEQV